MVGLGVPDDQQRALPGGAADRVSDAARDRWASASLRDRHARRRDLRRRAVLLPCPHGVRAFGRRPHRASRLARSAPCPYRDELVPGGRREIDGPLRTAWRGRRLHRRSVAAGVATRDRRLDRAVNNPSSRPAGQTSQRRPDRNDPLSRRSAHRPAARACSTRRARPSPTRCTRSDSARCATCTSAGTSCSTSTPRDAAAARDVDARHVRASCSPIRSPKTTRSQEVERRHEVRHRHLSRIELRLRRVPRGRRGARRGGRAISGTRITTCRARTSIILPGGFSYGDYLRAGAIARFSPIMHGSRARTRSAAGRCSASATASRSRARRTCCPARCCATHSLRVRQRVGARCASRTRTRSSPTAYERGPGDTRARSRTATGATPPTTKRSTRLEGEGHVVFRYVDRAGDADECCEPERLDARHRRHRERARATCSA